MWILEIPNSTIWNLEIKCPNDILCKTWFFPSIKNDPPRRKSDRKTLNPPGYGFSDFGSLMQIEYFGKILPLDPESEASHVLERTPAHIHHAESITDVGTSILPTLWNHTMQLFK